MSAINNNSELITGVIKNNQGLKVALRDALYRPVKKSEAVRNIKQGTVFSQILAAVGINMNTGTTTRFIGGPGSSSYRFN